MDRALIAELHAERFGNEIPWRERTNRPVPLPTDDDLMKARRRRDLNEAMDDKLQTHDRRNAA